MAEREVALVEVLLENQSIDPRFTPARQVRLVDFEDAVEVAHVEDELTRLRRERAAHAAATSHRGHRHATRGRPPQDGDHLLSARRSCDQDTWRRLTPAFVHDRQRPHVANRPLVERGGTDDLLELGSHLVPAWHGRPGSPRPQPSPFQVDTTWRGVTSNLISSSSEDEQGPQSGPDEKEPPGFLLITSPPSVPPASR